MRIFDIDFMIIVKYFVICGLLENLKKCALLQKKNHGNLNYRVLPKETQKSLNVYPDRSFFGVSTNFGV
jgi:hypothetical protein